MKTGGLLPVFSDMMDTKVLGVFDKPIYTMIRYILGI